MVSSVDPSPFDLLFLLGRPAFGIRAHHEPLRREELARTNQTRVPTVRFAMKPELTGPLDTIDHRGPEDFARNGLRFSSRWFAVGAVPGTFPLEDYKGDMDDWLARGLIAFSNLDQSARAELRKRLHWGLRNNFSVFGRHAFRKHRRIDQNRSVLYASLFDAMMFALGR